MKPLFAKVENQKLLHHQLLEELRRRRRPNVRGWSHFGAQFGAEPTSLALLALSSSPLRFDSFKESRARLFGRKLPNGTWAAAADAVVPSVWDTALAVNALIAINTTPEPLTAALTSLVKWCPLEASWLVRLKLRISDRQVRFDP